MWQCWNLSTTGKVCNITFGLSHNFIFSFLRANSFLCSSLPLKPPKGRFLSTFDKLGIFSWGGEGGREGKEAISLGKCSGLKNWLTSTCLPPPETFSFFVFFFSQKKNKRGAVCGSKRCITLTPFPTYWKTFSREEEKENGSYRKLSVHMGMTIFT